MKKLLLVLLLGLPAPLFSQCEIKNRLIADGSMQYFIEPVNFYWTKNKSLQGNIITDMENYFIGLEPTPFPEKPLGNKLKKDVEENPDHFNYERAERFSVSESGIRNALKRLGVSRKKKTLKHPKGCD